MLNGYADLAPVRPFNKKVFDPTVRPLHPIENDHHLRRWQKASQKVIEIGCGAGWHPIQFCQHNPQKFLLALERTKTKFSAFQQRIRSHQLTNLCGLFGDALETLPFLVDDNSIDQYFFLYPNPYPKKKQSNKRWHRSSFFHFVLQTLKTKGQIHIATNESFYYEECLDYLENYWGLKILLNRKFDHRDLLLPRTHFEKKYLARGQKAYEIICCKS